MSSTSEALGAELARIENAVSAGERDLVALGFWRVVAAVKRDRGSVEPLAEKIASVDRAAFRAAFPLRAPVWLGNALLLLGVVAGSAAVVISRVANSTIISGLAAIVAGGIWAVSVHCLAHWLTGRAVGIRFSDYYFGGPFPPRPGIKIDYASYLRTPAASRAWMHASGAIATKIAPFVALVLTLGRAPGWASLVLLAFGLLQIVTDLLFSVRSSDWKRFKRERGLVRDQRG